MAGNLNVSKKRGGLYAKRIKSRGEYQACNTLCQQANKRESSRLRRRGRRSLRLLPIVINIDDKLAGPEARAKIIHFLNVLLFLCDAHDLAAAAALDAAAAAARVASASAAPGVGGGGLVEDGAFKGRTFAFCEDEAWGGGRCGAEGGAAFVVRVDAY